MNLEVSLLLYVLSKIIVADLLLGPMISPITDSWPDLQDQTHLSSCARGLKSHQKGALVGLPSNIDATLALGYFVTLVIIGVHRVHS